MGLIAAAAAGAIIQTLRANDINTRMMALRQVQTAGGWISRDGVQAQRVQITDSAASSHGFPVTLSWGRGYWDREADEYRSETHEITYFLEDMPAGNLQLLRRREVVTGSRTADSTITVACYVAGSATTCLRQSGEGETFLLTITVTVGVSTESRRYQVVPRPDP
jgi:hypothetical protein